MPVEVHDANDRHDRRRAATKGCHPSVIEDLALGSLKQRDVILTLLASLAVDAGLLGSVLLVDGAQLWTRDKRLIAASAGAGVALMDDS